MPGPRLIVDRISKNYKKTQYDYFPKGWENQTAEEIRKEGTKAASTREIYGKVKSGKSRLELDGVTTNPKDLEDLRKKIHRQRDIGGTVRMYDR